MNQTMQRSLASLISFALLGLVFLGFGKPFDQLHGLGVVFICVSPVFAAVFLSSWFGMLLKRKLTVINLFKYYSLSVFVGIVGANAVVLMLAIGILGVEAGFEEFKKLGPELQDDIHIPIIYFSVSAAFTMAITTHALVEKPQPPGHDTPPETK